MVFICQLMWKTLFIRPGSNISPAPSEVVLESNEICTEAEGSDKVESYIQQHIVAADSARNATASKTIHKALQEQFGMRLKEVTSKMLELGFVQKCTGAGGRYYTFKFPGGTRPVLFKQ